MFRSPIEVSRSHRRRSPVEHDSGRRTRSPVTVQGSRVRRGSPHIHEGEVHPGSRSPTLIGHRPSEPITIRVHRSRSRSPTGRYRSPPPQVIHPSQHSRRRSPHDSHYPTHHVPRSSSRTVSPEDPHRVRVTRSPSSQSPLPVRSPSRVSVSRPHRGGPGGPPTIVPISEAEHIRPVSPVIVHVPSGRRRTESEGL